MPDNTEERGDSQNRGDQSADERKPEGETRAIGSLLQNAGSPSEESSRRSKRPNRNPFGEGTYEEQHSRRRTSDEDVGEEETGQAGSVDSDTASENGVEANAADSGVRAGQVKGEQPEGEDHGAEDARAAASAGKERAPGSAANVSTAGRSGTNSARSRSSGAVEQWPVPEGTQTPLVRRSGEPNVQSQFLLPETHAWVIDEMRARLKRPPYRYTKRQASQSNIVAMAIERFYEELMGEPLPEPDDDE